VPRTFSLAFLADFRPAPDIVTQVVLSTHFYDAPFAGLLDECFIPQHDCGRTRGCGPFGKLVKQALTCAARLWDVLL
jgi:hypothetical protein